MDGVTVVCAHSQALAQCQVWLNLHHPDVERRAVASNAEAARHGQPDPTIAAIASEMARRAVPAGRRASAYPGRSAQPHALRRHRQPADNPSGRDQTSLVLAVPNKAGAVYDLLAPWRSMACR